jgi:hypothetical protein
MQELMQKKTSFFDADGDRCSMTMVFPSGFLFFFEFLSMLNLSASGEVFWLSILYSGVKAFFSHGIS